MLLGYRDSTTQKYAQKYGYQFISLDDLPQPLVGSCGTNVNWSLNRVTGEMILSGSGAMYDYDLRETPWAAHSSLICSVIVSDGITSIGNGAFSDCENLANLSIGRDVTVIGNAAFCKTSLKNISIPDKVTRIGDAAFRDCGKLKTLSVSHGVKSIGDEAFNGCEKLETLSMSYGVKSIGKNAFAYCRSLQNFIIPDSVENIESGAFDHCKALTSMTIPHKVKVISDSLFLACSGLVEMTLPCGIERIGDNAFQACTSIKSLSIQNGIAIIGAGAFRYCENLTDITLPPTGTENGTMTYRCTRCHEIKIEIIPATGDPYKPCDGGTSCPSKQFTDVAGAKDWTHEGIDYVVEHGLFRGMSATTFAPNNGMTRAMLVTVLWRYAGQPLEGTNSFPDEEKISSYAKETIQWAVAEELVNGSKVGSVVYLQPQGSATRAQVAAILMRFIRNVVE